MCITVVIKNHVLAERRETEIWRGAGGVTTGPQRGSLNHVIRVLHCDSELREIGEGTKRRQK
jgi:hypothetical protein